jgi:hypothetical protein
MGRALGRLLCDYREPAIAPSSSAVWIEGCGEVDAVWPDRRLAVELDSREFHETRAAFERDRRRDTALQLAGYRILPVGIQRQVK